MEMFCDAFCQLSTTLSFGSGASLMQTGNSNMSLFYSPMERFWIQHMVIQAD